MTSGRNSSPAHPLARLFAAAVFLTACGSSGAGDGDPVADAAGLSEATPPPQALLAPGEMTEGELAEGETDRWIFATAGGRLVTVEVWFRPTTASGPEAEVSATLVSPDGEIAAEEAGTVTLPPYIVEQELLQAGSYLLRLDARSGKPGRYTLLVTFSEERLLTRQDVYTGTLLSGGPPPGSGGEQAGSWGFVWPSPQRAISGWYFHDPENRGHNGLDIAAALYEPIVAAASGTVSFAGSSGSYGNLVIVDHVGGWQSWYAHLSVTYVSVGEWVEQGKTLGGAGSTGYSTGAHLHFELRYQGQPLDPLLYLQ